MRSIRTNVSFYQQDEFKKFLKEVGLANTYVGFWIDTTTQSVCISYAYRWADEEDVCRILLENSSMDEAYNRYLKEKV